MQYYRIEICRVESVVTMNYEGWARVSPDGPLRKGTRYQIVALSNDRADLNLLASYDGRDEALEAGQKLATESGAEFADMTGGK